MTDGSKELSVVGGSFSLAPRNLTEAMDFAKLIAQSEICPPQFKGKAGDVLVAVQMGMEVGLKPLQAIQNIAVINGRPTMWGDACKALAEASGHLEYCVETWDAKTQTATCRGKRKGRPESVRTFSMEDAKRAGLASKDTYVKYGPRMCQMRARSYFLRDDFADVLKGLMPREEVEDYETVATQNIGGQKVDIMVPKRKSESVSTSIPPEPLIVPDAPVAEPAPPLGDSQSMPAVGSDRPKISDAQRRRLFALANKHNRAHDEIKLHLKDVYGIESTNDIPVDVYETVCAWVMEGDKVQG